MSFQDDPNSIRWRLHLKSPVEKVYQAVSTDNGRASFWAESAVEQENIIHFKFPNKLIWEAQILEAIPNRRYTIEYIGKSVTTFLLEEDDRGGTDLTLIDTEVPLAHRTEVIAGWVSVLMALKAAVDFGVDLRTHDEGRHWDHGYVEN
jgi:uncharacterized protein YndB with AHSA1/START domain